MSSDSLQLALIICASLTLSLLLAGLSLLLMSRFIYTLMGKGLAVRQAWTTFAHSADLHFTRFSGQPLYISGHYHGRPIRIIARPGSWNIPAYTRATVETNYPARLQLSLTQSPQTEPADTPLEQHYQIESQPAALATLLLADPTVRALLIQAQPARLFADHRAVSCHLTAVATEATGLQNLADLASAAAELIQHQIGNTIPIEEIPEEPLIPYSAAPRLLLAEIRNGNPKVLLALLVMLPSTCLFLAVLWRWLR